MAIRSANLTSIFQMGDDTVPPNGDWSLVVIHTLAFAVLAFLLWRANPPLGLFQIARFALILGGFAILVAAWSVLRKAQQRSRPRTTGVYARIRHPR